MTDNKIDCSLSKKCFLQLMINSNKKLCILEFLLTKEIILNMSVYQEFKKFALRGNVIDMAVGIVIGAAFGKIISSLVANIIMPPIGLITGGINFSDLGVTLKAATETSEAIVIKYGLFLNTIISFIIIAFTVFLLIRQINKLHKQKETKPKATPEEILLLREIRDSLKK